MQEFMFFSLFSACYGWGYTKIDRLCCAHIACIECLCLCVCVCEPKQFGATILLRVLRICMVFAASASKSFWRLLFYSTHLVLFHIRRDEIKETRRKKKSSRKQLCTLILFELIKAVSRVCNGQYIAIWSFQMHSAMPNEIRRTMGKKKLSEKKYLAI